MLLEVQVVIVPNPLSKVHLANLKEMSKGNLGLGTAVIYLTNYRPALTPSLNATS